MRNRHAGEPEDRAYGEHAALASAAFRPLPGIAAEFCRVGGFHGGRDAVVQAVQIAFDGKRLLARGQRSRGRGLMHDLPSQVFFFAALFLGLTAVLDAAAGCSGAFLFAAALDAFAASLCGVPGANPGLVDGALRFLAAPAPVSPASTNPTEGAAVLPVPLPFLALAFFLPHLPKVRTGAVASMVWHSSRLTLFGSRSFGILALRCLSVMYRPKRPFIT